jgi:hypothetical protein
MQPRCSGCGLAITEGTSGCRELLGRLTVREHEDYRYGRFHRVRVDAYCLQHPDPYCISTKSLLAHLCGLCCAFEYNGSPKVYDALQRSLNGPLVLEKPVLPTNRGAITIGDLLAATDLDSYGRIAREWGQSVWQAHAPLQPFARRWLESAVARPSARIP